MERKYHFQNLFIDSLLKDWKEQIEGGEAAGKSPEDFDKHQLFRGIIVELEHTDDVYKAMEIAMDHLAEHDDYYDKLNPDL